MVNYHGFIIHKVVIKKKEEAWLWYL